MRDYEMGKGSDGEAPQLKNLPYPPNPTKRDKERQMTRFRDILSSLQITIPFLDALEQIPSYAKYMKQLLSKKGKISEDKVKIETGFSALIQKPLPNKAKDPGSFTIPASIGSYHVDKALLDLGASINVMSLSMLKKIGGLEVMPTRMSLQLADGSLKFPYGVAENVIVKTDKFKFPVDFVILNDGENGDIPLILGRPFLVTSGAIIDVPNGELVLNVNGDKAAFTVCQKDPYSKTPSQHGEMKQIGVEINENDIVDQVKAEKEERKKKEPCCSQASCSHWLDSHGDPTKNPWPHDTNQVDKQMKLDKKSKGKSSSLLSCFKPP